MNPTQVIRVAAFVLLPIFAILLAAHLAQSGFLLPFVVAMGIILIAITATFPGWLLAVCIVFSLLTGRSGIGLGYWEIIACALVARWAAQVPFTGQIFGRIHSKLTLVSIAGFTSILILHGLPALLGVGDSVGRRIAVMAIAALSLAYLLLTDKMDTSKFKWLPWVGLLPGTISAGFDLTNLIIPAALPLTYFIYDGQNWEIIAQYTGQLTGLVRIAGFRDLGLGLSFLALSYFSLNRHFHIRSLVLQVFVTAFGAVFVVIAGYRNFVARIALGVVMACYHRSKLTFLAACIGGMAFVGTIIGIQNQYDPFPLAVQRALSFLPAEWDWQTVDSANSGVQWRTDIRSIFFSKIFPENWLLGRGLAYDERIQAMTWMAEHPAYHTEFFVMMQSYHSGLASTLDFVGVVGAVFLIVGSLRAILNSIFILGARGRAQPWHIWTVLMYMSSVPMFWYTGFFERSFPFIATFMCLLELARREIEKADPRSLAETQSDEAVDYELEASSR